MSYGMSEQSLLIFTTLLNMVKLELYILWINSKDLNKLVKQFPENFIDFSNESCFLCVCAAENGSTHTAVSTSPTVGALSSAHGI